MEWIDNVIVIIGCAILMFGGAGLTLLIIYWICDFVFARYVNLTRVGLLFIEFLRRRERFINYLKSIGIEPPKE